MCFVDQPLGAERLFHSHVFCVHVSPPPTWAGERRPGRRCGAAPSWRWRLQPPAAAAAGWPSSGPAGGASPAGVRRTPPASPTPPAGRPTEPPAPTLPRRERSVAIREDGQSRYGRTVSHRMWIVSQSQNNRIVGHRTGGQPVIAHNPKFTNSPHLCEDDPSR